MKIFVVVRYKDVEVLNTEGDIDCVTETEIIEAYGNKQDANFEAKWLNNQRSDEEDNILYDVIETELIWNAKIRSFSSRYWKMGWRS